MKKIDQYKDLFVRLYSKIHLHIHSHDFRKMVLLCSIVVIFIFNLSVLGYGKKIVTDFDRFSVRKNMSTPWEGSVHNLVDGTPMEKMAPFISRKDKKTAAFLVSIAKKESNWGERSPKLNGKDCYNYWGFRDQKRQTTQSGFSCFLSPEQAVNAVSRRIDEINASEPESMVVVWKCGYDCSWDNPASVKKWVSDVDYYFQKFYE